MGKFGKTRKKFWGGLLVTLLFATQIVGCSANGNNDASDSADDLTSGLVYVSFPDQTKEHWAADAETFSQAVTSEGFEVTVKFAEGDIVQQTSDVENAIIMGAKIIVVAAIDSFAVGPALEKAREQGITILAYDRLVTDTRAVDYYLGFRPEKIGELQAQYLIEYLGLERGESGPFNVELFAGSESPTEAQAIFAGAWDLLQPYFAEGRLTSQFKKINADLVADDWENLTIHPWTIDATTSAMRDRLISYLGQNLPLHAILSPSDSISQGIIDVFSDLVIDWENDGFPWPAITGQGATGFGLYNISQGLQGQTVWKDSRILAAQTAAICLLLLSGETVEPTDRINNGIIEVPTIWLDPVSVTQRGTKDAKSTVSVQDVIDSGYVTESQIQPFK